MTVILILCTAALRASQSSVFKTEAHILSFVVLNIFNTPVDNICLNMYFTNKSTHLNLHLYFRNQRNDRTFILVL